MNEPLRYNIIKYKIMYYTTKEHSDFNVGDFIDDTWYTMEGAINKANDLLFRKMYFKVEIYENNKPKPLYTLTFSKFNRKEYKETKNR